MASQVLSGSKPSADSRLWLALRLVDLPLTALGLDAAEQPAVVIEKRRVVCANAAALTAGVVPGMDVTTAQLLVHCEVHQRSPLVEQQVLAQLAAQLYQFTPYIEYYVSPVRPEAGLLLELSRCLQLFSGLAALTARIIEYMNSTTYPVDVGVAHSAKGAWLLSYPPLHGNRYTLTGDETTDCFRERLKAVPVQYLYDFPAVVDALDKTGFDTLGDIARQIDAQSISSIKKRFGREFTEALCDIFGIEQNFQQTSLFNKPISVYQPQEWFNDSQQFDYPISQTDQLYWPMENMLQKLSAYLRRRQWETQHIVWRLYDIYRHREELLVQCDHPQSHWQLLYDLTLIQLEQKQLPFEVDTLELTCSRTTRLQNRSQTLAFDNHRKRDTRSQDFAVTAAKLKARLGESAVFKLSYHDTYIPESSNAVMGLADVCYQQLPEVHRIALRPTWLFDTPLLIEERQQGLYWGGYLTILAGPERMEGQWWQAAVARDYFLVQRSDQARLWVFRDLHHHAWYVQGVFA